MGEVEKNPTIEIHLLFQDGVRLGWKLKRPISQVEIMRRMGIILAETDNDIDILLFETEDAGYVKVEPAEKSSNKDFLRLPIGQRRKLLKEQVEAFLKTNPDFRVNDGELAPCPLSEQCHDDMMADCEHCPYRRYAVAQLAHNKARMRKQLSELQGVCDRLLQDNTELTEKVAKMVKLPSEDELQADIGSILIKMRCEEHLDVVAGNYVAGKIAQELLKLLKGE